MIPQCKKLIADIGDMLSVQIIVEGSMNSSNPYFSSSWRRNFTGGFILDMGVHFIAGLRMLVGCEVVSVSAMTSHVDVTLPPPDNISSLFKLENGCSGVFVMVVSTRSPKACGKVILYFIVLPHASIVLTHLWNLVPLDNLASCWLKGNHSKLSVETKTDNMVTWFRFLVLMANARVPSTHSVG
ncbi:hypothetical protein L1049_019099 [Liquidambar formosana]|uniref:GFO/IDH/MocA-like oxidoreductase domain-containing protein n=1 Tax=Liquidambar formosana TaxID=63359 RepID=A0AAP0WPM3_LIQFO